MPRTLACALVAVTLCLVAHQPGLAQRLPSSSLDDYPQNFDREEASRVERAWRSSRMASRLAEDPFHPEALDWLFERPYLHHAMRHFERLAEQSPTTIAAAMRSLWQKVDRIVFDGEPYGYREVVLAGLPRIRARLADLPRGEAAPIVHHLLLIEHQLSADRSGEQWLETLARFIVEYRGTEASLLAEVDLINAQWVELPQAIPRLERFAADHPGTVAAAKAHHSIGFKLATRHVATDDARGGNHPLARLQRVAALVKELESGRYPRCEWTLEAAALMEHAGERLGSATLRAEPADVTLVLDLYKDFLAAHVAGDYAWSPRRLAEFVVRILGPVFERQGDRLGRIEAMLSTVETMVNEPAHVRLVRAEFYLQQAWSAGATSGVIAKTREALESLADEGSGWASGRALATLASRAFVTRDYAQARRWFDAYLARYPNSGWSWLAAIRLGQTLDALGDTGAAARAYRHPTVMDAGDPVVRALASARAASGLDGLGLFDEALIAYRRALEAADAAGLPVHSSDLRRGVLGERIGQLEQARLVPRGDLLERGRLALSRGRLAAATRHLEEFLASAPPASLATAEARALLHGAMLSEALTLATPGNPQRSDASAMQILDRLVNEPHNFEVGAAAVARAALLLKAGRVAEASEAMAAALDRMVAAESAGPTDSAASSIAEEVAAIETTLLRPLQEIPGLGTTHSLATDTRRTPSVLMRIDRQVRLATGEEVTARVRRPYPGVQWVLHLTLDQYRLLARVIDTAGRNKPQSLPAVIPPAPDPDDGPPFWERFFPASGRPLCESCPIIFDIEFLDEARTHALVGVALSGSGGSRLVLGKVDGQWRVIRVSRISMIA